MSLRFKMPSPALVISCFALLVALGPFVRAANTVGTDDIIDLAVTTAKLADGAVSTPKLAPESVTLAKIKGADSKTKVRVSAGAIPDGRCEPHRISVPGAKAGEMVLLSLQGTLQAGVFIYATQIVSDGQAVVMICNMSGAALDPINKQVRVITFG